MDYETAEGVLFSSTVHPFPSFSLSRKAERREHPYPLPVTRTRAHAQAECERAARDLSDAQSILEQTKARLGWVWFR